MATRAIRAQRSEVPAEAIRGFAEEFAAWRLGGCPGYGFHKIFKAKVEKVARKHGRSYGEVWAEVHAVAEPVIVAGLGA